MSGISLIMMAGGFTPPPVTREPPTGDRYDANNRTLTVSDLGPQPPFSANSRNMFYWDGVLVFDTGPVYYPDSPPTTVVVGQYTYYMGAGRSSIGDTTFSGIYRTY